MKKIKFKTKKALKKRVKVTGTKKLKRHCAFKGHFAPNKTTKQKRHLRKSRLVSSADYHRETKLIQFK